MIYTQTTRLFASLALLISASGAFAQTASLEDHRLFELLLTQGTERAGDRLATQLETRSSQLRTAFLIYQDEIKRADQKDVRPIGSSDLLGDFLSATFSPKDFWIYSAQSKLFEARVAYWTALRKVWEKENVALLEDLRLQWMNATETEQKEKLASEMEHLKNLLLYNALLSRYEEADFNANKHASRGEKQSEFSTTEHAAGVGIGAIEGYLAYKGLKKVWKNKSFGYGKIFETRRQWKLLRDTKGGNLVENIQKIRPHLDEAITQLNSAGIQGYAGLRNEYKAVAAFMDTHGVMAESLQKIRRSLLSKDPAVLRALQDKGLARALDESFQELSRAYLAANPENATWLEPRLQQLAQETGITGLIEELGKSTPNILDPQVAKALSQRLEVKIAEIGQFSPSPQEVIQTLQKSLAKHGDALRAAGHVESLQRIEQEVVKAREALQTLDKLPYKGSRSWLFREGLHPVRLRFVGAALCLYFLVDGVANTTGHAANLAFDPKNPDTLKDYPGFTAFSAYFAEHRRNMKGIYGFINLPPVTPNSDGAYSLIVAMFQSVERSEQLTTLEQHLQDTEAGLVSLGIRIFPREAFEAELQQLEIALLPRVAEDNFSGVTQESLRSGLASLKKNLQELGSNPQPSLDDVLTFSAMLKEWTQQLSSALPELDQAAYAEILASTKDRALTIKLSVPEEISLSQLTPFELQLKRDLLNQDATTEGRKK